ncbi:BREX system ATP-binding domain-containing protein [Lujinxingia litoralis]|nr:BREX system ATP-binding domain-containing protein [Lujinxingia litoralis]
MSSSAPHPDMLWRAYTAARYLVLTPEPRELRCDEPAGALDALPELTPETPWALITAHNPASRLCSPAQNARSHAALTHLIQERGLHHRPTRALDPQGDWPPEEGFLIYPLAPDDALHLARRFGQNAALIGTGTGPVTLLDCRPQPGTGLPPRVVEAMRLGVVPDEAVDAYTVGRHDEIARVNDDLQALTHGAGNLRVLLADYGAGKTHLLEVIARQALAQNFLVARVVLDARACSPGNPGRVYRGLIDQLTYPEHPGAARQGLTPLFERALQSPQARARFALPPLPGPDQDCGELPTPEAHLYLSCALTHFERLQHTPDPPLLDRLMRWVEGQPMGRNRDLDQALRRLKGKHRTVYSLKDYRPWARIYAYLLSGIHVLARDAGYAGLVLLFDEAERFALLSSENREHATNLFKAMAAASLGADAAPFEQDDLRHGGLGVLQTLPARYSPGQGLLALFAMTPDDQGVNALREAAPDDAFVDLNPLGPDDFELLAARVLRLYRQAHTQALPAALDQLLPRIIAGLYRHGLVTSPRQAMKFIVELLDIARHNPGALRPAVAELQGLLGAGTS